MLNYISEGCLILFRQIEQRLVQQHGVELVLQVVGQLPDDHLKLSAGKFGICIRESDSLTSLSSQLDGLRDTVRVRLL